MYGPHETRLIDPSRALPPMCVSDDAQLLVRGLGHVAIKDVPDHAQVACLQDGRSSPVWGPFLAIYTRRGEVRECFPAVTRKGDNASQGWITGDHPVMDPTSYDKTWTRASHNREGWGTTVTAVWCVIVFPSPAAVWVDQRWIAAGGARIPRDIFDPGNYALGTAELLDVLIQEGWQRRVPLNLWAE
jgi:hypothetical protein